MQKDQLSGALDRVFAVVVTWLLTWAATKGYITQSQVAELLPAIIVIGTAAWGIWVNRPKALVQAAANVPGTVVVTTPALAQATPNDSNIISTASSPNTVAAAVEDAKVTETTSP